MAPRLHAAKPSKTRTVTADRHVDRRARFVTSLIFFAFGVTTGTWGSRIPAMKDQAQLSNGELGVALLAAPVGVLLAMQFTARLVHRHGSGRTTKFATVLLCAAFPLPALAHGVPTFAAGLFLTGLTCGALDSAMNTHASVLEHRYRRPIMSSIHGFFSLGALVGSVGGAAAAHADWTPFAHCVVVAVTALGIVCAFVRWLLPATADADADDQQHRSRDISTGSGWTRTTFVLGLITFCAFLGEGAAYDWSVVHLNESLDAGAGVAAFAIAAFSLSMCTMRFLGDGLVARIGRVRVLRLGGVLAGLGLGSALLMHTVAAALVGWAVFGVGLAVVAPTTFAAAGNVRGIARPQAIARVAGIGWTGVLLGPAVVGTLAEATTLDIALGVVALLATCIALLAPAAREAR